MARNENPPFGRGETFYNGGTIDSNNLGGLQHEGKIWEFEDLDYTPGTVGARKIRTGRMVKCMCVRNVAAAALLPKRLVNLQTGGTDGRFYTGRVDGYVTTTAARGYPVDEFLTSAGVPVNDLFWVVVEGPAKTLTDLASGAGSVFNVGDIVVALTAATSGATTAGRVAPQNLNLSTTALGNQIINYVGHALSAAVTTQTNADLLVEVGRW